MILGIIGVGIRATLIGVVAGMIKLLRMMMIRRRGLWVLGEEGERRS
jgi:hypothetical protein